MKDFETWIKEHKKELFKHAKSNTRYNESGLAVIQKADDWFCDDSWETKCKGDDKNE